MMRLLLTLHRESSRHSVARRARLFVEQAPNRLLIRCGRRGLLCRFHGTFELWRGLLALPIPMAHDLAGGVAPAKPKRQTERERERAHQAKEQRVDQGL